MEGFRINKSVSPPLEIRVEVFIINECIVEFKFYVFDLKSECLSEPSHVTFRGVFEARVRYVHYTVPEMDHGRTPSERVPQENGSLPYRRTFTPQYPVVMHTLDRHEVCSVTSMSMPGSQIYLYERFPIRKLSQQGPYPDSPIWGEATSPY